MGTKPTQTAAEKAYASALRVDPSFPIQYYNLPAGIIPKLHSDEQSPLTFNTFDSVWLPPEGFDGTGRPYYHPFNGSKDPYERTNKSYQVYQDYAQSSGADLKAKQAALTAATTTINPSLIVAGIVVAILGGLMFAKSSIK